MDHVEQLLCEDDPHMCADAFALWASTRDVRDDEGERELAQWMPLALVDRLPQTVIGMVPLIPEYGSWYSRPFGRKAVFLIQCPTPCSNHSRNIKGALHI